QVAQVAHRNAVLLRDGSQRIAREDTVGRALRQLNDVAGEQARDVRAVLSLKREARNALLLAELVRDAVQVGENDGANVLGLRDLRDRLVRVVNVVDVAGRVGAEAWDLQLRALRQERVERRVAVRGGKLLRANPVSSRN